MGKAEQREDERPAELGEGRELSVRARRYDLFMPTKRKYTAALLAPVVASSHSLAQVMRKLGLRPTGGMYRLIAARVREFQLDVSHFGSTARRCIEKVPVDTLETIVRDSSSLAQVLTRLGLTTKGRAHHELKKRLEALHIDTAHMRGQGWSRGETKETHPSVARISRLNALSDEEVFVERSSRVNDGPRLVQRLLKLGWDYRCSCCGIAEWQGKPLVLHLDHINGIANDNRLVNLRLLCPNCHSQTDTYCNRTRPQPTRASEPRARYSCYTFRRTASVVEWQTRSA